MFKANRLFIVMPTGSSNWSLPWVKIIHCLYTGCNRRKGPNFGRVFLMWNYTEKNPKHLYPKLNGLGDNRQWNFKLWQLLHTYWLPNSYWNWQEYVVSVMLISVLNIKVTCEWHRAIKLNDKNTRHTVVFVLRRPSTVRGRAAALTAWRQSWLAVCSLPTNCLLKATLRLHSGHTKDDVSYDMIFYYNNL